MCKVLKVSVSGYYYWLRNPVGLRELKQKELLASNLKSKCRYGSPRIWVELREQGILASRPRVAKVMSKAGLKSLIRQKYRVQTTDSNHVYTVAENYLDRDFFAQRTAEKWVSEIRTGEGWLYLTTILDLADRKVIGWALSDTMQASETSVAAWQMAIRNRPLSGQLLFHSDRGVQYACREFREQLEGLPVLQSMSRKGNCWDNAVAESFFKTMKTELVYHDSYITIGQAKMAIFAYMEIFYNRERRHSALGYLTPCQYESMILNKNMAA